MEHDELGMERALARHDAVLRAAIEDHAGYVFSTAGDSFAAAFKTPVPAVAAAIDTRWHCVTLTYGYGWPSTLERPTSARPTISGRR